MTKPLTPVVSAILWSLHLDGDVNETHKGGNASKTLFDRIQARGFQYRDRDQFTKSLNRAKTLGYVSAALKDRRTYYVRLLVKPDAMPANPFASTELAIPEAKAPAKKKASADWRDLPISQRLELCSAIQASVVEDMAAFKTGVTTSL